MQMIKKPLCSPGICICCKSADEDAAGFFDWETDCEDGRVYVCAKCAEEMAYGLGFDKPKRVKEAYRKYFNLVGQNTALKTKLVAYEGVEIALEKAKEAASGKDYRVEDRKNVKEKFENEVAS